MDDAPIPAAKPTRRIPTWLWIVLSVSGLGVLLFVLLFVLAVRGVTQYSNSAKTAEARSFVSLLGKQAVAAYYRRESLCPSAAAPVPSSIQLVAAQRYRSSPADWAEDDDSRGFGCIGFSMQTEQFYQYMYTADMERGFVTEARGDLDGDGELSRFSLRGELRAGELELAQALEEEQPEE